MVGGAVGVAVALLSGLTVALPFAIVVIEAAMSSNIPDTVWSSREDYFCQSLILLRAYKRFYGRDTDISTFEQKKNELLSFLKEHYSDLELSDYELTLKTKREIKGDSPFRMTYTKPKITIVTDDDDITTVTIQKAYNVDAFLTEQAITKWNQQEDEEMQQIVDKWIQQDEQERSA